MPNTLIGQRFNIDDRVIRKFTTGFPNKFKIKQGSITEALTKTNKVGVKQYYYKVLWDDKRSSEHAQYSLESVE
jgi:hypothetical protein